MVLPRNESSLDALLNAMLLNDPDPQVRLAALLALSEMPSLAEAGAAVFAMLQDPRNSEDRWIPDAAVAAAARHDAGFLKAVLSTYKPAAVESSKASLANLIPIRLEEQNGAGPAVGGPRPTAGAGNLGSPRRPHGRGSAKISSNRAEMSVGRAGPGRRAPIIASPAGSKPKTSEGWPGERRDAEHSRAAGPVRGGTKPSRETTIGRRWN